MPARIVHAYYGMEYELHDCYAFGPARNGHRFTSLALFDPEGNEHPMIVLMREDGTGPIYAAGGAVSPPYGSIPTLWEHVPRYSWFDLETGDRAVLVDGVPCAPAEALV